MHPVDHKPHTPGIQTWATSRARSTTAGLQGQQQGRPEPPSPVQGTKHPRCWDTRRLGAAAGVL